MNPTVTGSSGVVVITQVIPPNGQQILQVGPNALQNALCQVPEALKKFFKGEPKALGVTQILIGLIQIILAIILATAIPAVSVISVYIGVPFWGGLFFIISGSLSVSAQNKANMCLVKGSLGMNIISAIAAFIGIIIFALDISFNYFYGYNSCSSYGNDDHHHGMGYYSDNCLMFRGALLVVVQGIKVTLLLLMILEFCISISTSAFGCKAACCNSNMQPIVILQNESRPEMNIRPMAPPMYNEKDHYRPEARYPSVPAPMYNESNQYRPEGNLSVMAAPMYNEIDPYRPQANPPPVAPLIPNNNEQNGFP
ncbi:membrane-spanning 4-domains subfamily A member 4A-like isoform X2 [Rhinatrema bivittatum]|uniref:membrane-spanning 4-domains subfamily A member 4A-like isoform X2 n=1 Tax=Rhinatrema bivittatum TaxID=194408 RepID=UPI0011287A29|nr:membrane-spanning 4-domains subfamily A member 4A-like isoform X2 [Rhinatrema bivittatum]